MNVEDEARGVVRELGDSRRMLALAESCTGGLVAAMLTAVPGASEVLWGSAVVYSPASKRALLDLDPALLRRDGTVSSRVTAALATAVRRRSGADLGAAVTGWAGPSTGGPDPVGTVFLALDDGSESAVRRLKLDGDRQAVRRAAAGELLAWVRSWLRSPGAGGGQ